MKTFHCLLILTSVFAISTVKASMTESNKNYADHCIKQIPYNGLRACFYSATDVHGRFKDTSRITGYMATDGHRKLLTFRSKRVLFLD